MNERWWLVEGVIVEDSDGNLLEVILLKSRGILALHNNYKYFELENLNLENYKPVGVPFDCMPEKTTEIRFSNSGYFQFYHGFIQSSSKFLPFPKCPEQWKGKTFEITEELRELIND